MKGIYRIYCIKTNDSYIGSTTNLERRRGEHFDLLCKGTHFNYKLQRDCNKYGIDSFKFEALEECSPYITRSKLYDKEQVWIDKYEPKYNIQKQARDKAPTMIGIVVSDQLKGTAIEVIRYFTDIEGYIILEVDDAAKVKNNGGIVVYIKDLMQRPNELTTKIKFDYIIEFNGYNGFVYKVENMLAKYSII